MANEKILETIRQANWFAFVPDAAHVWLAERCRDITLPKGRLLCSRGQPMTHAYGIMRGKLRMYLVAANGDECTIYEPGPGDWIPDHVPGENAEYLCDVIIDADSHLLVLGQRDLLQFAENWPGVYRGLYHNFSSRIIGGLGRLELLSSHNLSTRLAVYLLYMAQKHLQFAQNNTDKITLAVTQSDLASRIGSTRPRVNAKLNEWSRLKLIQLEAGKVAILDLQGLKAEAARMGFDFDEYF